MKRISFTKVILIVLAIALLGFGLTGCNVNLGPVAPPVLTTGTVKLVVTGTNSYDLTLDGVTIFSNAQPGTYTINSIPIGNHSFEAIDVWGATWGYDSVTKYIYAGSNYVYLYPDEI